jgi:predicted NUDIX family NTP pyrophosphohydrolase
MAKQSAGLLPFRLHDGQLEVFLVHPGGPFWAKKDAGAWSIPKGEFAEGEDLLATAQRELAEETGFTAAAPFRPLGTIRQPGGKVVHAFAVAADFDPARIVSNTFELEWPPRSGRKTAFPEVDRAAWFDVATARQKMNAAQTELLDRLVASLVA